MKWIGSKIFGTVIALFITAFLVYTSFFSQGTLANGSDALSGKVTYSSIAISNDGKEEILSYKEMPASAIPDASHVSYAYFWRLSSFFYLPEEDFVMNSQNIARKNMNELTISSVKGIFSWYDPFQNYTVTDTKNDYKITQITNGSIYVGSEADGTVSIYSIDLVADLTFMHEWVEMSKIIIFPGMYVRFDPKMNAWLKDADLFRIMLALNQGNGSGSTGIEFVDPRVQAGENQSIFFMYRLPRETRDLFVALHAFFGERVRAVDLLKSYSLQMPDMKKSQSQVVNPTKKMFYLLGELQAILSRAVSAEMTSDEFHKELEQIYAISQNVAHENNNVQDVIEQFLIDGRFAIFLDARNGQYQAIYNQVANILGIAPTTGKGKFFQSLSNIFSKNLLRSTNESAGFADTYNIVGNELKNTLSVGEIDTNDYFDLSLYAFLMFEKLSDGKILDKAVLEGVTLPELYVTIFQATQRYVSGIANSELANIAQKSLLIHFYEPMMDLFVRSLYATYTKIENGRIFLSDRYVVREDPQFSPSMESNLKNIYNVLNSIRLTKINEQDKSMKAYRSLEANIVGLQWFVTLIQKGGYKNYILNPYLANGDTGLPLVENGAIVHAESASSWEIPEDREENSQIADSDVKRMQTVNTLKVTLGLATLTADMLVPVQNGYALELGFTDYKVYFVYNTSTMMMNDVKISTEKYGNVRVVENLSVGSFKAFMGTVPLYLPRLDVLSGEMIVNPATDQILLFPSRNQVQIGGKFFPLIQ